MQWDFLTISHVLPEIIIAVLAMVLLVLSAFKTKEFARKQIRLTIIAIVIGLVAHVTYGSEPATIFHGHFIVDGFASYIKTLLYVLAVVVLYMSLSFYRDQEKDAICEYPVLVMFAFLGMLLMVSAGSLLSMYLALELQSLSLYVLASIHRDDRKSSEAGAKYFLLGSLASGLLLYGISLVYGFSGTISFESLATLYVSSEPVSLGLIVGLVLVMIGFCFKISAVPFHMWTPDVYEGVPTPVTALFATLPKIAALGLFAKLLVDVFGGLHMQWQQVVVFVGAASMIVGALGAIRQQNIKRLLAYSSIGHVGYITLGIVANSESGIQGILMYFMIYGVLSLGIFSVVMMLRQKGALQEDLTTFAGLSKTRPMLALLTSVLLLSMAGIPPFAGFFGKFFLFLPVLEAGHYALATIGALSSVVAAYYYLKIIKLMYFDEPVIELDAQVQPEIKHVAIAVGLVNVFLLLFLHPLLQSSSQAAVSLF